MSVETRDGWGADAKAWLDADGYHVWQSHRCPKPGERACDAAVQSSMLPYPTWGAAGQQVQPSISCGACGLHVMLTLSAPPPPEWRA